MNAIELIQETVALYERHGWKLQRALLTTTTRALFSEAPAEVLRDAKIFDAEIDALWFARPSTGGREAWELRLVTEQPYALFEAFESDETEEDRDDARREIENRMREHASAG